MATRAAATTGAGSAGGVGAIGDSSTGFYAHIPTMQQAMDDLMISAEKLKNVLGQLQTELQPMISTWSGSAQECYAQCQAEWNAACTDMQNLLTKSGITVDQAATLYGNTDLKIAGAWQQMKG
jgi:WXG100 family type VII secretion target